MFYGLSTQWPFNPGVFLFLLVLSLLYFWGIIVTRRRIQRFNMTHRESKSREMPLHARHTMFFYAAIALAALATLTPIDTIARTQLFTIHIAQLVLLTTLCTPLIMFGCPEAFLQPFIDVPVVRHIVRMFTQPVVASLIFNLAFLLWHTPLLLHASIANNTLYNVQVLSIFIASFLNWWPLIGSVHEVRKMSYPMQILFAFFDGQPVDILAFVLVFSEVAIYPYYNIPVQLRFGLSNGLTHFADQAAGGALLLIPGLVDFVVMTPLFFKWFGMMEKRTRLADEHRQQSVGDGYSYGEDYYGDDDEEYEDDEIEEHVALDSDR